MSLTKEVSKHSFEMVHQYSGYDVTCIFSIRSRDRKVDPTVGLYFEQVVKPKRPRHPESDSDDDDELLTPEEREARGIRGLTREQVIRMAKKSDASKRVLKQYESPTGSRNNLGQPVYLLNQQEMDEELKQFRSFFAHGKTPASTSTPRADEGSSTPSGTFKRETSTEVTRSQHTSVSSVKGESSGVHRSYQREESTSSSITKRTLSAESTVSQKSSTSVTWKEDSTVEKKVFSPALLDETAIDTSLQELDQMDDVDQSDSSSRPTAVVRF